MQWGVGCLDNLDLFNSPKWKCVFSASLNELTVSRARMCIGSWFQALGPTTANARVPKCVTEEETTRSPRVEDRSLCLLPTVVTSRQRSAMYGGASPCRALYVSRHSLNWSPCDDHELLVLMLLLLLLVMMWMRRCWRVFSWCVM